jgi:hypothetical protein
MSNIYYNIPLDNFINKTEESIEKFMKEIYKDEKTKNSEYEKIKDLVKDLDKYVLGKNNNFIETLINTKQMNINDKVKYKMYIASLTDKNTDELLKELQELNKIFPPDNKQKGGNYNFKYFYDRINFFNKKYNNPDGKIYKIVKIGGNNENIEDLLKYLLKDFKSLYINALIKLNDYQIILDDIDRDNYINSDLIPDKKGIDNRHLKSIIDIIKKNKNFFKKINVEIDKKKIDKKKIPYSSFSIEKE